MAHQTHIQRIAKQCWVSLLLVAMVLGDLGAWGGHAVYALGWPGAAVQAPSTSTRYVWSEVDVGSYESTLRSCIPAAEDAREQLRESGLSPEDIEDVLAQEYGNTNLSPGSGEVEGGLAFGPEHLVRIYRVSGEDIARAWNLRKRHALVGATLVVIVVASVVVGIYWVAGSGSIGAAAQVGQSGALLAPLVGFARVRQQLARFRHRIVGGWSKMMNSKAAQRIKVWGGRGLNALYVLLTVGITAQASVSYGRIMQEESVSLARLKQMYMGLIEAWFDQMGLSDRYGSVVALELSSRTVVKGFRTESGHEFLTTRLTDVVGHPVVFKVHPSRKGFWDPLGVFARKGWSYSGNKDLLKGPHVLSTLDGTERSLQAYQQWMHALEREKAAPLQRSILERQQTAAGYVEAFEKSEALPGCRPDASVWRERLSAVQASGSVQDLGRLLVALHAESLKTASLSFQAASSVAP